MTYKQIFDEYEGKFRVQDKKIFGQFLEDFKQQSGVDWKAIAQEERMDLSDYTNIFWVLHTTLFNNQEYSKYIPLFYQLLEDYHYNLSEDYISFIRLIGQHTVYSLPDNVRNFVSKAPYIDGLSDRDGKITIHSDKLGNITFYSTRRHFFQDYFINLLLKNNKVVGQCHNISWRLMDYMPGTTLVTSLVASPFMGTAYHSVIRTKENLIIDASNSCVFTEENYHNLFHDEVICETKSNARNAALSETSLLEGGNMANAMVLALHEQQKKL